jgi:hypothetical protein
MKNQIKQAGAVKNVFVFAFFLALAIFGAASIWASLLPAHKSFGSATAYFSVESFALPKNLVGQPALVFPMDFDHDGDLDIVIVETLIPPEPSPFGNGRLFALRNDGLGHFADATSFAFGAAAADTGVVLLVADYNKDGRDDLFVPCWGNDREPSLGAQNRIFFQTPQGRLVDETIARLPHLQAFTANATIGDIDGDGDMDIYCPPGGPPPLTSFFLINDGKGYFAFKNDNLPADLIGADSWSHGSFYGLLVDVDKDGDLDMALHGGGTSDRLLLNNGKGYFKDAPAGSMPIRFGGRSWGTDQAIAADFNKDGWPDLIMHSYEDGSSKVRLLLLLNNGDGTFRDASKNISSVVVSGWSRAPVDFNNDGWMDFFDSDVNCSGGLRLFMNKGNAQFVEMRRQLLPSTLDGGIPSAAYPFDLDNDGDIDIFAVRGCEEDSEGNITPGVGYVFQNLKAFMFSSKILFPALLQAPAKGATGIGSSVVLRWTDQNKKPYPEETQYQVRIKFGNGDYSYYNVQKGRAYLKLSGLRSATTYSWNVKAVGNGKDIKDSEWAVSGNDWTFTTK